MSYRNRASWEQLRKIGLQMVASDFVCARRQLVWDGENTFEVGDEITDVVPTHRIKQLYDQYRVEAKVEVERRKLNDALEQDETVLAEGGQKVMHRPGMFVASSVANLAEFKDGANVDSTNDKNDKKHKVAPPVAKAKTQSKATVIPPPTSTPDKPRSVKDNAGVVATKAKPVFEADMTAEHRKKNAREAAIAKAKLARSKAS